MSEHQHHWFTAAGDARTTCAGCALPMLTALEHAERLRAEAQKCAATTFNGACYWRDTVVPDLRTRLAEAERQRDHFRSLLKAP